jgi:hypothetical protein
MQQEAYEEALNNAVRILLRAEIDVFHIIAQVATDGPFKDKISFTDPCEALEMELPMFEHTEDANLQALAAVVKHLCQVRKRLIEENALVINLDDE